MLRYCICDRPGLFDAQFFFTFFLYGRETALQNDAICSDVTRSTRAVYAQIARVAVERESSYSRPKFTSGQNSKTPYMRNSTRMRITLTSVSRSVNGLPVVSTAKCLGYWWGRDLFASKSIYENTKKARRAFFSYGSIGAFQGDLNPLSSKSIIDTCVMPILLFGSENWILSDTLLCKLEAFLGELSKRALKWPMHLSNTSAVLALDMALENSLPKTELP